MDYEAKAKEIVSQKDEATQKRLFSELSETDRAYVLIELRELTGSKVAIRKGMILLATDDTPEGLKDAKAWLASKKITPQDARLFRDKGQILVEALDDMISL